MIRSEEAHREHTPPVGVRWHEYADIFPWIEGEAYRALVEDIRKNGVLEPIVFLDGAILDGRNRYMAARELGVEYPRVEYEGNDPLGFVISHNLTRRHLDASQRAMVAKRLETAKHGGDRKSDQSANLHLDRSSAAEMLNVSPRSIATAATVMEQGAPELIAAVDAGRVSVSAAADVATLPKEEQAEIVARGEKEILQAAKAIRAEKVETKRAEKIAQTQVIAANNAALPVGERKYSVIYADPPWSFDVWSGAGKDRAAENHYPTMTQAEIEALPVEQMAADDCALFMWAVMPQLPEALAVIKAWGFEYKTCAFVWVKQTKDEERFATGMGYWTRANAEICLLATRGSPARLNADVHQVIATPRMEHSKKPADAAERIERLVPGPYLEMFARSPRDGWDVWGNQAEAAA
jgi:N6-adenosine-specific RNA methylase IME4